MQPNPDRGANPWTSLPRRLMYFARRWKTRHGPNNRSPLRSSPTALAAMPPYYSVTICELLGSGAFNYVLGMRVGEDGERYSHAWLPQGDTIIDITADQFPGQPPVIVTIVETL